MFRDLTEGIKVKERPRIYNKDLARLKGGKVWKGIKWKRKKKIKGKVGKDYQRNEWKEKKKRKDGKGMDGNDMIIMSGLVSSRSVCTS